MRAEIPFLDFLTGTRVQVRAMDGRTLTVKIPKSTKPGTKLRVRAAGHARGGRTGDLYLQLEAKMPKNIPDDVLQMIESIKGRV